MNERLGVMGQRALSSSSTLRASYDMARQVVAARIPGDLVECGVFAGAQVAAMAMGLMDAGCTDRKVHLFDSFEGIPAGGEHDLGWIHPAGTSACSVEAVQAHMKEWCIPESMLVYHPGLFADTVPECDIAEIAILRLDGDLYESTEVCMAHLYPKLSVGGWCIVDDFHLPGCRRAVTEHIGYPAPTYFQKHGT